MIKNATMISPMDMSEEDPAASRAGSLTREHSMTPAMYKILEGLYNELRNDEPELSRDALASFIRDVQGVAEVELKNETYALGEFLYALASDCGWDAVRKPGPKDYSKPITNYFINSSHNTYISGNQLASKTSPEAYTNVCINPPALPDFYNGTNRVCVLMAVNQSIGLEERRTLHRNRRLELR